MFCHAKQETGDAQCQGWCCHWLRAVRKKVDEGAIICCVVSNIYNAAAWRILRQFRDVEDNFGKRLKPIRPRKPQKNIRRRTEEWVKKYHAGSSEVSDAVADQYKLKRSLCCDSSCSPLERWRTPTQCVSLYSTPARFLPLIFQTRLHSAVFDAVACC